MANVFAEEALRVVKDSVMRGMSVRASETGIVHDMIIYGIW